MRIIAADHEPGPLPDTSACDAAEAHVDERHTPDECGWLTLDEQRIDPQCGHPIGYCTAACDGLPAGFDEAAARERGVR